MHKNWIFMLYLTSRNKPLLECFLLHLYKHLLSLKKLYFMKSFLKSFLETIAIVVPYTQAHTRVLFTTGVLSQENELQSTTDTRFKNFCKKHGLTEDIILREVSEEHILKIYDQLENWKKTLMNWRRGALSLGLSLDDLLNIEYPLKEPEERILYTFGKWKELGNQKKTCTYEILLKAVLETEPRKTADSVCSKCLLIICSS